MLEKLNKMQELSQVFVSQALMKFRYDSPLVDHNADRRKLHPEITEHIFANAPTMLALCLTAEGLIKIYAAVQQIKTLADDLLVFSVAAFLFATIFSYLALRSAELKRKLRFSRLADGMFLCGLVMALVVSVFVVFTLAG